MYTEEEKNLIVLDGLDNLTYHVKYVLLSKLLSPCPDFVKFEKELIKTLTDGVYNKVKAQFSDENFRSAILNGLEEKGIKCVTYFSENYPEGLKNIPQPPLVLYCKGNTELLKGDCFAIVGSRRSTPKALILTRKISSELTKHFTIVSGIADGADGAALEGALSSGKVISVLAYGHDNVYPSVNASLLKRVCENGLTVTEYPPKTLPASYNFPRRNLLIAGISNGVLCVSAGEKSGALITATDAADLGKPVFAFPYEAGSVSGAGCNNLIKKGASLTENTLDILNVFGIDFNMPETAELNEREQAVYDTVSELGDAFITDVASKLNKQPFELLPVISMLELKGLIVRLGGNRYSAVSK